ncbi:hypothetical protein [Streptomyces sp. NPDC048606]|uniref:hypothetical protein n=1 Tax=Streptomyces sp. NPDC048606 TaxID=3154726 RepID=UPI003425B152
MTAAVNDSWTRIENWLAEHAPATHAALAPPADPADIAATERVVGGPLPRPLVASLLRHDGVLDGRSELFPGSYVPRGAREIAGDWRHMSPYFDPHLSKEEEARAEDDLLTIGSSFFLYGHPRLIPLGREVGGGGLVLDHRGGIDRGRVHRVEPVEGVRRVAHEAWTSLPLLLEGIAGCLEAGRPLDGHAPAVDDAGRLRWE